jgi:hypothetical protein
VLPTEGAFAVLIGGLLSLQAAVILPPPDKDELDDDGLFELPQAASEAAPKTIATPDTVARRNKADTFPPEEW